MTGSLERSYAGGARVARPRCIRASAGRLEIVGEAELGGGRLIEPMDIGPNGRIAVAQDPHGATFALYSGRFED